MLQKSSCLHVGARRVSPSCMYRHRICRRFTGSTHASEAGEKGLIVKAEPFQVPHYLGSKYSRERYASYRYRHGIIDYQAERLTVRELAMMRFMDAVTDKKLWHTKVFDEAIVAKWREEVRMQDGMVSDRAFEWCLRELRDKAGEFEKERFVKTLDSETGCVKSDTLISEGLRCELRQAVEPLLAVKEENKDWHPGSDGKVLNLVHPSMYPLVCGRSKSMATGTVGRDHCFESIGKGMVVERGEEKPDHIITHGYKTHSNLGHLFSKKYQWLPAEVRFSGNEGTDVKLTSYVNNLHPTDNHELYGIIERVISESIPLWNSVLMKGSRWPSRIRIKVVEGKSEPQAQPSFFDDMWEFEDDFSPVAAQVKAYAAQPDNPQNSARWSEKREILPEDHKEWDVDDVYQALEETFQRTRTIIHPEPGTSPSYEEWKSRQSRPRIEDEFRSSGLQVIVKLSSIELSPLKPDYAGGTWHLEGMLNEGIVATSIYYYDVANVTESRIRFSQEATLDDYELVYAQDDHDPLAITFGADSMRDEPAVQEIGNIVTRQGRIIAFPNTMRHKVEPFSLADRTKPGHRRFLVIWLVDPHVRIMSTADVAPQQLAWARDAQLDEETKGKVMRLEEAEKHRLELMKERTTLNHHVEGNFDTYNLCEH